MLLKEFSQQQETSLIAEIVVKYNFKISIREKLNLVYKYKKYNILKGKKVTKIK
jgi:hypothetical protein